MTTVGSGVIRVDSDVLRWIAGRGKYGQTPNDVLRKVAKLPPKVKRKPGPKGRGPKYPKVVVQLTGRDNNAFEIVRRVSAALRRAKASPFEIQAFRAAATLAGAGDMDTALQAAEKWVEVV